MNKKDIDYVGPDDGGSVFAGAQIGRNASQNNDLYIGGETRIPFPGRDYDLHSGLRSVIGVREDSIGTNT